MTKEKLDELNELNDRINTVNQILLGFRGSNNDFNGDLNIIACRFIGHDCYHEWKRTQIEFWDRKLEELRQEFEKE